MGDKMKKIMTIVLIGIMTSGIFSQVASADVVPEPVPPQPIEYRVYTGDVMINQKNGNVQRGRATLVVNKIPNENLFGYWYYYCIEFDMGGACIAAPWRGWIEGKMANGNWMIRSGNFAAVLGEKNGHVFVKSSNLVINMRLMLDK